MNSTKNNSYTIVITYSSKAGGGATSTNQGQGKSHFVATITYLHRLEWAIKKPSLHLYFFLI
jgi:hypothetical protein